MSRGDWKVDVSRGGVLAVSVFLLALAGCRPQDRVRPAHLSGESRLVGGGLTIQWQAPEPGVVYLVEKRTGKLVQTFTLEAGETYKFSIASIVDADDMETLLGIGIEKTQFLLYFKPAGGREPAARAAGSPHR